MSDKLQTPHSIKVLHDAIVTHLTDFTTINPDDFSYVRKSVEFGIEYFHLLFARVVSTPWNCNQEDLGFIRLRPLSRSLTEMLIEDSPGLRVGPDLFLDASFVRFGADDDDEKISVKQRKIRAVRIFERFKAIHQDVREYIIQALQEDRLLEVEETKSKKPSKKPPAATIHTRVFISYAHEDIDSALKIYEQLKAIEGVDPWFDKESLLPGIKWRPAIKKAIRESDFFLALLSQRSISKRGYVQTEMKEALEIWDQFPEDKAFLIPIRLEDCYPSYEKLREVQYQDFFLTGIADSVR